MFHPKHSDYPRRRAESCGQSIRVVALRRASASSWRARCNCGDAPAHAGYFTDLNIWTGGLALVSERRAGTQ